jgi:hypothetical protein
MGLSFLSDRSVTSTVAGRDLKFFPVSVWTALKLRKISSTIAKSAAVLFEGGEALRSSKFREVYEGGKGGDGGIQRDREMQAIDPKLAEMRHLHRQAAIDDLLNTLMLEENGFLLADFIKDSLREESIDFSNSSDGRRKFLETLSVDILAEIVAGLIQANKAVFDPLVAWVREMIARAQRANEASQSNKPTAATGNS